MSAPRSFEGPRPTPVATVARRVALGRRNQGYAAAVAGREAIRPDDPDYMSGYRAGTRRRRELAT